MIWALFNFQNRLTSLNRTGLDKIEGLVSIGVCDDDRSDLR